MAKRELDPRLKELYRKGAKVYSISKLNALDGCLREAYFSYRDEEKPPRVKSIYGIMGGEIHEVLEGIYNNECGSDALLPALNKELQDAEMIGVDFPKDFKGGTMIRDNWIADMTHFCNHFEMLEGDKFTTEELVLYQFGENQYMQGYIDLIVQPDVANEKIVDIIDFKTSTKFKKDDLTHHGRQLVFYGAAMAALGYEIRRVGWVMLKYVKVTFDGYARSNSKHKTTMEKVIQRGKLAKELEKYVEQELYEAGYEEIDVEIYLEEFRQKNDLAVLPEAVRELFNVEQYVEYYDYNEETIAETMDYIKTRADKFEELWDKPKSEWTPVTIDDKNSFYCNNLCSHREHCEELKKYNDLRALLQIDEEDLF